MPIVLPPAPPAAVATAPTSIAAMKGHRRVLIIAAPSAGDPALAVQRNELAAWRREGEDRDVTVVEIVGPHVTGTVDTAAGLRRQWRLHPDRFEAILIGKDGTEAFRADKPVAPMVLTRTIDAMPMRRAGQR